MIISDEQNKYAYAVTGVLHEVIKPCPEKFPEIVWHYTSSNTLVEIIKSHSLWSTQISCLNDTSECRHFFDLIFNEFLHRRNSYINYLLIPLYDFLQTQKDKDRGAESGWFVASFCMEGDDLNLWRAYAGGEGGVAVGFNSKELIPRLWKKDIEENRNSLKMLPDIYLLPVIYEPAEKDVLVKKLCDKIERFFLNGLSGQYPPDWTEQFWNAWEDQLLVIAPIIKHQSFASEKEWRLIKKFPEISSKNNTYQNGLKNLKYVARRTTITRHWPVEMPPVNTKVPNLLPLVEIKIGPGPQKDLMKTNIKYLLLSNGYTVCEAKNNAVRLTLSEIPFRSL